MWGLILVASCLWAAYLWLKSNYNYWRSRGVPQPEVNLFFGNMTEVVQMKKSLGQLYSELYDKFPDCAYIGAYRMRTPVLLIRDPEILKQVLVTNFNSFHDNDMDIDEKVDPYFAKNAFAIKGDGWKAVRNRVTPCFSSGKMKALFAIMQEIAQKFVKYIEEESVEAGEDGIETKELCAKFTTENVVNCAFGLEAECFKNAKSVYREMGRKMMNPSLVQGFKLMLVLVLPSLSNFLRIKFVSDEVGGYFRNLIQNIVQFRKDNNIKRNDFMDNLLELRAKDQNFTMDDLIAQSIGLFSDGFETSSVALSFILYDLAANPHVQETLRKEIDELIEKDNITYEGILGLPYMEAVISESLRMHPPAMFNIKRCTRNYELPPARSNAKAVIVETGTPVMVPYYSFHMDEKYFPNPEKFDPGRFLGDRKAEIQKCTYMPFGDGPRICLGQRFALMQIKIAIFNVVSNFDMRVSKKTIEPLQIDPNYFLLSAKGGLWIKYHKRQK